jgi:uncharacterized membrane protein
MTKKQFVLSAFVAAIPAFLLIAVVVLVLMDAETGILTDGAKPSIALWVAFVGSALGALVMGVLPFAVMIFPGLMMGLRAVSLMTTSEGMSLQTSSLRMQSLKNSLPRRQRAKRKSNSSVRSIQ